MGYNAIDLLGKAIIITEKIKTVYKEIEEKNYNIHYVKVLSSVLIKQLNKNIHYLEQLRKKLSNAELEEIDFWVYDKISFLVNEFNQKSYSLRLSSAREYLQFSLNLEKDAHALLIDMQGRYVKSASDTHTNTYRLLSTIIKNNAKHLARLEKVHLIK